jgi:hypothetical protein
MYAAFQVGESALAGFLQGISFYTLYFPGVFIGGNKLDRFSIVAWLN